MSLWFLLAGCAPVDPSWALLDPVVEPAPVEVAATPPAPEQVSDPRFDAYAEVTAEGEEGWGPPPAGGEAEGILGRPEPDGGAEDEGAEDEGVAEDASAAEAEGAAGGGGADEGAAEGADPGEPEGMPSAASWGVRLVQTFERRQPPRALLGLPDGQEVVVSAGSMLPDVGLVVIAVGQGMIQLAQVLPEGDHATIETTTLQAQYGGGGEAAE